MNLTVIILNWNGTKDTKECLQSLQKQTDPNFSTIVLDNGSIDRSIDYLEKEFPFVTWIFNSQNDGFAKGNNIAILKAIEQGSDAVFLLNNDTVLDEKCIEVLKNCFIKNPNVLYGCQVRNYFQKDLLDHIGGIFNLSTLNFDLVGKNCHYEKFIKDNFTLDYLSGCSLLIPTHVFSSIGFLDERFFLIWEEADFCMRAKRNNFFLEYSSEAIIYHKVSQSFQGKAHQHYFWWRNRLLFLKKHSDLISKTKQKMHLGFEVLKLVRHYISKSIQYFFSNNEKKQLLINKIDAYKASLRGVLDFFDGRFGSAPNCIFKKRCEKRYQKNQ